MKNVCNFETGDCVECNNDTDCFKFSSQHFCNNSHICIECQITLDCNEPTKQYCNNSTGRCVPCLQDIHCQTSTDCNATCSNDKKCITGGLNCGNKQCSNTTCVDCLDDDHCPNINAPYCDRTIKKCIQCRTKDQCSKRFGNPHCYDSFCVECLNNQDCINNITNCGSRCIPDAISPKKCSTNTTKTCTGQTFCSQNTLSCITCEIDSHCNFYAGCSNNQCELSLNKTWYLFVGGIIAIGIIVFIIIKWKQGWQSKTEYNKLNSVSDFNINE